MIRRTLTSVLLIAAMAGGCPAHLNAQSEREGADKSPSFPERLMNESEGRIEIISDQELLELLLSTPEQKRQSGGSRVQGMTTTGFRIQVFSDGRNQHSLEARAKARGSAIIARFPKYRGQVYTFSSSPNWYTRIGNFRTQHEADNALRELKASFPQFASEMRVVKSKIVNIK
ncbi:MAG: SPOR domain-containing protein [Muribaculaceae bacterium]|nr:SPOR domain-containing protein [Muribaculaceae bacterium]